MKRAEFEDLILDYIENVLDTKTRAEFERSMAEQPELAALFRDYLQIMVSERELRDLSRDPGPAFSVKVMDRIEEGGAKPFFKNWFRFSPRLVAGVVSVALAVLVIREMPETVKSPPRQIVHEVTLEGAAPSAEPLPEGPVQETPQPMTKAESSKEVEPKEIGQIKRKEAINSPKALSAENRGKSAPAAAPQAASAPAAKRVMDEEPARSRQFEIDSAIAGSEGMQEQKRDRAISAVEARIADDEESPVQELAAAPLSAPTSPQPSIQIVSIDRGQGRYRLTIVLPAHAMSGSYQLDLHLGVFASAAKGSRSLQGDLTARERELHFELMVPSELRLSGKEIGTFRMKRGGSQSAHLIRIP